MLISIDFEKAFDTIEWSAIRQVLEHFDFESFFIGEIQTLYNKTESCVINNGFRSGWFPLSRSCRQGCPILPLIFNLVVEILSQKLRQNTNIRGLDLGGETCLGAQYADDFWLSLIASEENISMALVEF